ncbi:hypothetical protein CTI18_01940 [Prevotella intermedia]|uniref:Uncharacterized protein n=1 Tax=Prevotella intermedia TaxID=28131 RepID=A0A2G8I9J7_PREIN|nr:hypothetical protein CTI18_01940 [Prevotella intermedia]
MSVLQNLLFCVPKAALLHGKSVGFATQNSRFRNIKAQLSVFKRIIFTKLMYMRVMLKYDESINKKSPQAVKNCVWTF